MRNPRITAKERNLIKGAIRRVFSRSDLRKEVINATRIDYHDPNRPRVTKWSICVSCKNKVPTYLVQVDHVDPIVPLAETLENMSWDIVIDRVWCDKNNLQPICKPCHTIKTAQERKLRRAHKQGEKANGKTSKRKRSKKTNPKRSTRIATRATKRRISSSCG